MRAPPLRQTPPPPAAGIAQGSNRISSFLNQRELRSTPTQAVDTTIQSGRVVNALSPVDTAVSENVSDAQSIQTMITAGSSFFAHLRGIAFYFTQLTGGAAPTLDARPNTKGQPRTFLTYAQGTGLQIGAGTFSTIEIKNNTAATITFTIVVLGGVPTGRDEFIDHRVTITGSSVTIPVQVVNGQNTANVLVQNAPTTVVGFKTRVPAWAESLGGGATQDIADGFTAKGRKQVFVSNNAVLGSGNVLVLQDSNSNPVGTIQPGTAFTFETGGDVKLFNPNVGAVACNIGEVYYV